MSKRRCPCKECMCVPVCRHKTYLRTFGDCILLRRYEPHYNLMDRLKPMRIVRLQKALNPTVWQYTGYQVKSGVKTLYAYSRRRL